MRASEWFKTRPVNLAQQVWHVDGSVTVTIHVYDWKRPYSFKAKVLLTRDERIIEDEEIVEEDAGP